MKIYNHDIILYTHDPDVSSRLYSGRALCLTTPEDKIQIIPDLASDWDAIVEHYAAVGLQHSHDVIWDISVQTLMNHDDREISVYFFGDVVNSHNQYRQFFQQLDNRCCQVIEFVNSKNNFIQLAEELDIPVPKTLRFSNLEEARLWKDFMFPCFVKPAISDHGFGIMRCADSQALDTAFAQLDPDEPLQVQEEVNAATFLNLQYHIGKEGVEPLLVSEQILDDCVHLGNRYPASHEPWEKIEPFAQWMSDRGMKGIFAVDVAAVPEASGTRYVAIECNPRFNGSSYPTIVAKRLNIPVWSSATYKTKLRSLKDLDLTDIAYTPQTQRGIVLINWGTIQAGKVSFLVAGSETEQSAISSELKKRL